MTHEEFKELSGAYVLGAVTPEERQSVREHLATCESCASLERELRAVVDLLPLSVTQVTPSAALKERLLETIRQEQARVIPIDRAARRRRPRWGARLLAVAAIVVLMLFGGMTAWNVSLLHQVATLQQQNTQLGQQVTVLQGTKNSQENTIALLKREVAQIYNIKGNGSAQLATGSLLYIPQKDITLLVLHGLPQLKGTQIYQGWLIHGKKPVSIGMLTVQNGIASVTFPGAISGYEIAAVSQEPGPSLSKNAPVGPVIATGDLLHPTVRLYIF
jgi:anti-sigma-K factor RskA